MQKRNAKPVILFDGYCNLCSSSVVFIIKRDIRDIFRFASLQSDIAGRLLSEMGIIPQKVPDSVVLIEKGNLYTRSKAALQIVKRLKFPWPLLYGFIVIPGFIRDPVYDWIAKNRYKWFGKRSSCFIPKKDVSHKFMDQ